MEPLDDIILEKILRTNASNRVYKKEDEKIEFKSIFDNSSKEAKAKYAKELAAFYNCEGGYLIFGVEDKSKLLIGLNSFTEPDNAILSNDINNYFSPRIQFQSRLVKVKEKDIFVIYTNKRNSIPTVCTKPHDKVLTESTIYWRYSAKSSPIRSGDLITLLSSLKGEDNKYLAEITKKDLRSRYRPILYHNGLIMNKGLVKIKIENRGQIAILDEIKIIEKNVDHLEPPSLKGHQIKGKRGVEISIKSQPRYKYHELEFKLEIYYHDDIDHKYKQIYDFKQGEGTLSDPTEI